MALHYTDSIEEALLSLDSAISQFKDVDFNQWSDNRRYTIWKLQEISQILKKVNLGSGIGKTTGGAVQIAGGVLTIIGICTLNPVLTLVGVGVASGGGVTSAASSIAKYGWTRSKNNELAKLLEKDCQLTTVICQSFINLSSKFKKISQNKKLLADIKAVGKGGFVIGNTVVSGINIANKVALLRLIGTFVDDGAYVATELTGSILADGKFIGLAIFDAGSVAAKSLEGVLGGISVVFGIVDIIFGAKDIANGSDLAKKIDDTVKQLETSREELTTKYLDIQKFL